MKLKVLFLTIIIILALAGAGSVWVWQKEEDMTPLPIVNNEQENGTPNIHTDVEVIQPRINPKTGWKIFEHPDVPITFEYPGGFDLVNIDRHGSKVQNLFLQDETYNLEVVFEPSGKDVGGGTTYDRGSFLFGKKMFAVDLLEIPDGKKYFWMMSPYYENERAVGEILGFSDPTSTFIFRLDCRKPICPPEARTILKSVVSSIRLVSGPR